MTDMIYEIDRFLTIPLRMDMWQLIFIIVMTFIITFTISFFFEEVYTIKTDEFYINIAKKRLEKENKKWKN